jgi:hypothetical protein
MTAAKKAPSAPLMTTAEAAVYLRFEEEAVKDWRRRGVGPDYFKVNGAHVRYRVEDLDRWLDKQRVRVSA